MTAGEAFNLDNTGLRGSSLSERIKAFEITPANVDESVALCELSLSITTGAIILADKGYFSQMIANNMGLLCAI